jgi:hypothetical protein
MQAKKNSLGAERRQSARVHCSGFSLRTMSHQFFDAAPFERVQTFIRTATITHTGEFQLEMLQTISIGR